LRDELGHSDITAARPLQAATASAASFFIGGLLPLLGLLAPTATARLWLIVAVTLIGLAGTGILGARIAGTHLGRPALRVIIGGGLTMLLPPSSVNLRTSPASEPSSRAPESHRTRMPGGAILCL
jgi:vacuolar iron transporter family protein